MKKDVYEMVTDRIIEQLEQGVIPWQKPWGGVIDGAYNRLSKKPYSLIKCFYSIPASMQHLNSGRS